MTRPVAAAAVMPAAAGPCLGQASAIRTYCNPLDIEYKYDFEQLNEASPTARASSQSW